MPNYGEVLVERAAPSILQWAIEGAVNFVRNGYKLIIPECVAVATEEYQAREDWLSNFIAECCTPGGRVSGGDLYAAYRRWAEHAGEYVRRSNDFVAAMKAAGHKRIKPQNRTQEAEEAATTAHYVELEAQKPRSTTRT